LGDKVNQGVARLKTQSQNEAMLIGYARVSTGEQNPDPQHLAPMLAGCEQVFEDQVSGATVKRPGLDRALALLGAGDALVVWRLDPLGRSLSRALEPNGMVRPAPKTSPKRAQ
jgi:hypothetical protein